MAIDSSIAKLAAITGKSVSDVTAAAKKVSSGGSSSSSKTSYGVSDLSKGSISAPEFTKQLGSLGIIGSDATSQANAVKIANASWNPTTQSYGPVNPELLRTNPVVPNIPAPIDNNVLYNPALAGANATLANFQTNQANQQEQANIQAQQGTAGEKLAGGLAKYLGTDIGTFLQPQTSQVDTYNQLYKQSGVKQAQQNVSDLTSQLNNIVARQQANLLQLRQTGSQEGVTEAVYGGQQATINREAAIQALPVAAQLEAAQGNLKAAEDHINTLMSLYAADAQAETSRKNTILELASNMAGADQQEQLASLKRQQELQDQNTQITLDRQKELVDLAKASGDLNLAARIAGVDPVKDPQALTKINSYGSSITTSVVAGTTTAVDTTKQETQALQTAGSVDSILNDPAFSSTFGLTNIINRNLPGSAEYVLKANVDNLIANLALAARGQLKGQGAVSDFEGKMLRDAQTALTLNMTPDQAKKELKKVSGAIRTSSGLTAPIKITDTKTKEVRYGVGDTATINEARAKGYLVEYN